ncbi:unnamed protein product [Protopolystoma xenopodis]|uniref:Uncharacterized protein n=1 Tax=Protopolystoma xenopodis TaxID=117903 RepID=A0A448XDJ4_9PLAT|nr:unnamed protein product [Protopolystoma xenopodis]
MGEKIHTNPANSIKRNSGKPSSTRPVAVTSSGSGSSGGDISNSSLSDHAFAGPEENISSLNSPYNPEKSIKPEAVTSALKGSKKAFTTGSCYFPTVTSTASPDLPEASTHSSSESSLNSSPSLKEESSAPSSCRSRRPNRRRISQLLLDKGDSNAMDSGQTQASQPLDAVKAESTDPIAEDAKLSAEKDSPAKSSVKMISQTEDIAKKHVAKHRPTDLLSDERFVQSTKQLGSQMNPIDKFYLPHLVVYVVVVIVDDAIVALAAHFVQVIKVPGAV